MRKKVVAAIAAAGLLLSLSACGFQRCKAQGCDDKPYKDGYCQYHFTLQAVDNAAKDVFNTLFGN